MPIISSVFEYQSELYQLCEEQVMHLLPLEYQPILPYHPNVFLQYMMIENLTLLKVNLFLKDIGLKGCVTLKYDLLNHRFLVNNYVHHKILTIRNEIKTNILKISMNCQ